MAITLPRLFIDTSVLRGTSFGDPDFNKLLSRSKAGMVRIIVSHIAWEERRSQFLVRACDHVRKIRDPFENLKQQLPNDFVLGGLRTPSLELWGYPEIEEASKQAMDRFAAEHKIEIIGITPEHARRSWENYFRYGPAPPFKDSQEQRSRRMDIPDSWIYEAAVDLINVDDDLYVLCNDTGLSDALAGLGAKVFKDAGALEAALTESETTIDQTVPLPVAAADNTLADALLRSEEQFRGLEQRVLGFVAFMDAPTKDKLFVLLARAGIATNIAENITQRLTIAGLLQDTGAHFIVPDEALAEQAALAVENEMIDLLKEP